MQGFAAPPGLEPMPRAHTSVPCLGGPSMPMKMMSKKLRKSWLTQRQPSKKPKRLSMTRIMTKLKTRLMMQKT